MDIENKIIKVKSLEANLMPTWTKVNVEVHTEIMEGVSRNEGSYFLTFDKMYPRATDVALIDAIEKKLQLVPEQ